MVLRWPRCVGSIVIVARLVNTLMFLLVISVLLSWLNNLLSVVGKVLEISK